jgi:putative oxidoreductase
MKNIFDLLARVLISFIFLYEAYDSLFHFDQTKKIMTEYGLTWKQDMLLLGAIFFLILGSLLVLIGYRSGLGSVLLLLYWVPVTFIVHSFWNDPQEIRHEQSILFMKNLAIVGGLLMVYVNGSGKYSIKRLFATTRVG